MTKRMMIDATQPEESRVVILNDGRIEEYDFVTSTKKQIKGNIYLAKITRVEPSLQAAFVEYGGGKQGFLPFSEIHTDYYQIPISDRKRLIEEQEALAREEEEAELAAEAAEQGQSVDAPAAFTENSENTESVSTEHGDEFSQTVPAEDASSFMQNLSSQIAPEEPDSSAQPASDIAIEPASEAYQDVEYKNEATGFDEPSFERATFPPEENISEDGSSAPANIEEAPTPSEVETLGNEEEVVRQSRRPIFRRYKIQEVIKRNQIVLVQVIKEERGNKGVSLTTYISLAGRYCVLMPNSPKDGGISRKISSSEDRRRLKQISSELRTSRGMSVIIRTAGTDRTRPEIKRDYEYLVKLWNNVREQTIGSTAPALIYEEGDLVKRSIRDMYNNDIEEILVEGDEAFRQSKDFMKMLMPSHAPRVKHYREATPLFYAHEIEDQLVSMYDPIVKLRSGGYIVISPTEALISIDVNSGRSTGERNIEETALKTNQEAAQEIARQIRLRDLAGLLVIDFIDMMDSRNRRNIERALKDALKLDRAKIQLGRISPFGLLEMSRQRLRPSIAETSTSICPTCQGKGTIRSNASVGIQVLRALKKEASTDVYSELRLITTPDTALYLLNQKRDSLSEIELAYNIRVTVQVDQDIQAVGFRIEKIKLHPSERRRRLEVRKDSPSNTPVSFNMDDMDAIDEAVLTEETLMETVSDIEELPIPSEDRYNNNRNRGGRNRNRGGNRGGRNRNRFERGTEDRSPDGANASEPFVEDLPPMEGAPLEAGVDASTDEGRDNNRRDGRYRERGGRGRGNNRRYRGRNDRYNRDKGSNDNNAGGDSYSATPESGSFAPSSSNVMPMGETVSFAPSPAPAPAPARITTPAPISNFEPPATESSESKGTKKGWWRRIVE
jgi:ribonuclease E